MAVPRNRTSNARKNSRRAHHAKKPKNVSNCSNCSKPRIPHRICPHCGFYAGRAVVQASAE
ncbi:MAG: 50S ribosomal protein L32 [Parachlamydiales bacterium]|nr:50S ribosomal protein L32 [Verrucomicrobiota bacterium]MBX3718789.1 50S ribosomal protein L32 [Candidatus Acheromyda pituitae]